MNTHSDEGMAAAILGRRERPRPSLEAAEAFVCRASEFDDLSFRVEDRDELFAGVYVYSYDHDDEEDTERAFFQFQDGKCDALETSTLWDPRGLMLLLKCAIEGAE